MENVTFDKVIFHSNNSENHFIMCVLICMCLFVFSNVETKLNYDFNSDN